MRTEVSIRSFRAEIKGHTSDIGKDQKRNAFCIKRIEALRQSAYIWRSFGDAIAFLYMDKYALKQAFYNTENLYPKQDAGFLLDKTGLFNEIALLEQALSAEIPALLVDLTNSIRHGDVCLMRAPDPYLIEVKTSKRVDRRGQKQKRSLQKIQELYENDTIEGFRGLSRISRETTVSDEQNYIKEMNECMSEAVVVGHSIKRPEDGLLYFASCRERLNEAFTENLQKIEQPWIFFLNETKSSRSWAPYLPFTFSIESKEHLWSFIRGDLVVIVVVDAAALTQRARQHGFEALIDQSNGDYPLQLQSLKDVVVRMQISSHLLRRIAYEFVSPGWMISNAIEMLLQRAERTIK